MKSIAFSLIAVLCATPVLAEDLVQRNVLNEQPLSDAEGMKVVVSKLVLLPGGRIPLHTHPGDEHAVMVVGGKALMPNGKEIDFPDGTPMFFPAGQVHGGVTNADETPIEIVTTHIVAANAPFSTPAE